jgi:hypothetical protein
MYFIQTIVRFFMPATYVSRLRLQNYKNYLNLLIDLVLIVKCNEPIVCRIVSVADSVKCETKKVSWQDPTKNCVNVSPNLCFIAYKLPSNALETSVPVLCTTNSQILYHKCKCILLLVRYWSSS